MKTAVFVSVRMKSTRLPQKAILEIKGWKTIEHLIDRVKQASRPDLIVLCTSTHHDDQSLVDIAVKNGIDYFCGSENDKLDRYLKASLKFGIEFMVIVDGDDIFCDPEYIDKAIETFEETGADFITAQDLPLGAASFGLKLQALQKVCDLKEETDTEVWGAYFTETGLFQVKYLAASEDVKRPEIRMTLDYPEDFEFFKAVIDGLYKPGQIFTLKDIISYIDRNPQIMELNIGVQDKYLANLAKAAPVNMRKGESDR